MWELKSIFRAKKLIPSRDKVCVHDLISRLFCSSNYSDAHFKLHPLSCLCFTLMFIVTLKTSF